jgi:putative membrane protein
MKRLGRWVVLGVVATGGIALAQGAVDARPMGQASEPYPQEGRGGGGQAGQMPPAGQMGQKAPMLGNLPMPQDEQALVNHLHHMNLQEIQLAQLAQQKATSPDVKQYAQSLITDHQMADQKLTALAQTKGLKVGDVRPGTDVERKKVDMEKSSLALLQSLEGPPFEQQFLTGQVAMHDLGIGMVTAAQTQFATSELAPLLKEQLPKLKDHRARAYRLLGEPSAARQARTPPGR